MTTNWANQKIWTGDNLPILRGMNSDSVDLIYLDPPFNSETDYAAPIGSQAAGAEFKDTWTLSDVDAEWINLISEKHPALNRVLLAYMAVRLLELHRVLKSTGSIYLHCDPTMSHYLKLVMDAIFGRANYLNEISWVRPVPKNDYIQGAVNWPRTRNTLLHSRPGLRAAVARRMRFRPCSASLFPRRSPWRPRPPRGRPVSIYGPMPAARSGRAPRGA